MEHTKVDIRAIPAAATHGLRRTVLKPGLPAADSVFPGDAAPSSFHLGAFLGQRLVGVASFHAEACPLHGRPGDWRLRGMATLPEVRGHGIGSLVFAHGIREVTDRKGTLLWCHGRVSARRFYERHGMCAVGDEFLSPNTGPHFLFTLHLGASGGDPV